jgi:hypothetical protein
MQRPYTGAAELLKAHFMHTEIMTFLKREHDNIKATRPAALRRVLEVGSATLHNQPSPRDIFQRGAHPEYIGVDWRQAPGVDVVGLAHKAIPPLWQRDTGSHRFGVVICCQVLEHDPHWQKTVSTSIYALRANGVLLLTWAGPGTPEHEHACAPRSPDAPTKLYYRNVPMSEVRAVVDEALAKRGVTFSAEVKSHEAQNHAGGNDLFITVAL